MILAYRPARSLDAGGREMHRTKMRERREAPSAGGKRGPGGWVPQRQKATGSEMCDSQKDKRKAKAWAGKVKLMDGKAGWGRGRTKRNEEWQGMKLC